MNFVVSLTAAKDNLLSPKGPMPTVVAETITEDLEAKLSAMLNTAFLMNVPMGRLPSVQTKQGSCVYRVNGNDKEDYELSFDSVLQDIQYLDTDTDDGAKEYNQTVALLNEVLKLGYPVSQQEAESIRELKPIGGSDEETEV